MSEVRTRIEKLINDNPVVLFMKGTPQFPQCGFSGRVAQILDYLGPPSLASTCSRNSEIRQGIKDFANWPTIPQPVCEGRIHRRRRHRQRNVQVRRTADPADRRRRRIEEGLNSGLA